MDYQGTLLFSLILSIVNTTGYYVMTVYNLKKKIDEGKHELVMMFGITFVSAFLISIFLSGQGKTTQGDISTSISGGSMTHSARPPF